MKHFSADNAHSLCKGKYHCTHPALLDWIQPLCYVKIINRFTCLVGCIQDSKTGDQPYRDTSPYKVSILWRMEKW